MRTKFLQSCIGLSIVIVSITFFIWSINDVHAAPGPDKFLQQNTNKIGKYQACYSTLQSIDHGSDIAGSVIYSVLIIDTETGKTVLYYNSSSTKYMWKKDPVQLPQVPFD